MVVTSVPPTEDPTMSRAHAAGNGVQQRRLAGAVRSDQADDLTRVDVDRRPVERDDASEPDLDVRDTEYGFPFDRRFDDRLRRHGRGQALEPALTGLPYLARQPLGQLQEEGDDREAAEERDEAEVAAERTEQTLDVGADVLLPGLEEDAAGDRTGRRPEPANQGQGFDQGQRHDGGELVGHDFAVPGHGPQDAGGAGDEP